jgi:4-amino-4-deoxy-L-arabinose transferase-like glycosyltransferase
MKVIPATLFGVRLFSVIWIPISIWSLYLFMRRVGFNEAPSLLAALLHGLSFVLIDVAKNARPDMMCQALGWSALAAYASLRERSLVAALVFGNILVALSGLTHPNGVLYFAGLWLLVFWFDRARLNWRHIALSASVYAVAAGLWGIYILQDPAAFADQLRANSDHRFGTLAWSLNRLPLPLRLLWGEIHDRYLALFGLLSPFKVSRLKGIVLLTYAFALVAAFFGPLRRGRKVKLLLALWALFFGIQCVFNQKLGFYFLHIAPLYAALTASVGAALWVHAGHAKKLALAAWLVLLLGIQVASTVSRSIVLSTSESEREVAAFLAGHARSAQLIFGNACLIHTVGYDPRYRDDRYLGLRSGKRADVIIMTDHLDSDLYAALRTDNREDWDRISQRLSEYRLVFAPPGYRVYFSPAMLDARAK